MRWDKGSADILCHYIFILPKFKYNNRLVSYACIPEILITANLFILPLPLRQPTRLIIFSQLDRTPGQSRLMPCSPADSEDRWVPGRRKRAAGRRQAAGERRGPSCAPRRQWGRRRPCAPVALPCGDGEDRCRR